MLFDYTPLKQKVSISEAFSGSNFTRFLVPLFSNKFISTFTIFVYIFLLIITPFIFGDLSGFIFGIELIILFSLTVIYYSQRDTIRYEAFAKVNNLKYDAHSSVDDSMWPAILFRVGHSKYLTNTFSRVGGLAISGYSYSVGEGKSESTYYYTVAYININKKLPATIFDNKQIFQLFGSLPILPKKSQKVNLEGDFSDHFDVYLPENYHVDVLSYITPEIMIFMKERMKDYDIEIIGDKVFIYKKQSFNIKRDIELFLKDVVDFAKELNDNVEYYKDDRVSPSNLSTNSISPSGQNLKVSLFGVFTSNRLVFVSALIIIIYVLFVTIFID